MDLTGIKRITQSECKEYFRKYGIPNAVDEGNGLFGVKSGSLFIDDETGEPVAYCPANLNKTFICE